MRNKSEHVIFSYTDTLQIKAILLPLMKRISSYITTWETCEYLFFFLNCHSDIFFSNVANCNINVVSFYRTVTNTRLTYIYREAFENNQKLQYLWVLCYGLWIHFAVILISIFERFRNVFCGTELHILQYNVCATFAEEFRSELVHELLVSRMSYALYEY